MQTQQTYQKRNKRDSEPWQRRSTVHPYRLRLLTHNSPIFTSCVARPHQSRIRNRLDPILKQNRYITTTHPTTQPSSVRCSVGVCNKGFFSPPIAEPSPQCLPVHDDLDPSLLRTGTRYRRWHGTASSDRKTCLRRQQQQVAAEAGLGLMVKRKDR